MLLPLAFFYSLFLILKSKSMSIIYKRIPVEEISLDELCEKQNEDEESTLSEYRLGLYCKIDTEAIGLRVDLSRLFKQGLFTGIEKKSLVKKLADLPLSPTERKAFQRALVKLRKIYFD